MVIAQGEVWWTDLASPAGSGPGYRRPVLVVQGNALNQSRIATVICVPLTEDLKRAKAPGDVLLGAAVSGLPRDSVANVSQIVSVDKELLVSERSPAERWNSSSKDLISCLEHESARIGYGLVPRLPQAPW